MQDKELKKIIHSVSLETYTEKGIVEEVIMAYYKSLKDLITEANTATYSSFPSTRIPHLGTLFVSPHRIKRAHDAKNNSNSKSEESVQQGDGEGDKC